LPDCFVGECSGAGDDADGFADFGFGDVCVDVAGHDADFAAVVCVGGGGGVVAGLWSGGDDAGAVRADECEEFGGVLGVCAACGCVSFVHDGADADHVVDGYAFGDAADDADSGVHGFEDSVCGEGGRDEDHGGVCASFFDGVADGVEDWEVVCVFLSAFAWGDATDHFGAVVEASCGVECARGAGDALGDDFGVGVDEDGHCVLPFGGGEGCCVDDSVWGRGTQRGQRARRTQRRV